MTLLQRALQKSGAPFGLEEMQRLFERYGDALDIQVERNGTGQITAFAILTPPVAMMDKWVSSVVFAATDGTVDARALFERLKIHARKSGADTLMAWTWRDAWAVARRFGGVVDSAVRWDLEGVTVPGPQEPRRRRHRKKRRKMKEAV